MKKLILFLLLLPLMAGCGKKDEATPVLTIKETTLSGTSSKVWQRGGGCLRLNADKTFEFLSNCEDPSAPAQRGTWSLSADEGRLILINNPLLTGAENESPILELTAQKMVLEVTTKATVTGQPITLEIELTAK